MSMYRCVEAAPNPVQCATEMLGCSNTNNTLMHARLGKHRAKRRSHSTPKTSARLWLSQVTTLDKLHHQCQPNIESSISQRIFQFDQLPQNSLSINPRRTIPTWVLAKKTLRPSEPSSSTSNGRKVRLVSVADYEQYSLSPT